MGWTHTHRKPGMTTQQFFEQEFPATLAGEGEILASRLQGSTFYAAVRDRKDGTVWAMVVLTSRQTGHCNFGYKEMDECMGPAEATCPAAVLDLLTPLPECDHAEQYCKHCHSLITEQDGQWVCTPTEHQVPECGGPRCWHGYPASARQEDGKGPFHAPGGTAPCSTCYARNWRERCRARLARIARSKAVGPGATVKFSREIEFGDAHKGDTFLFEEDDTFYVAGAGLFRVPGWREMDFEVVPA